MSYVFIHGLGQNASSWDKTISYIRGKECAVSPELVSLLKDKDITYENLYHAFSEYLNNASEPLNLCGLSLGAVLALQYTIEHPEKVKSLICIAGQYKMPKGLLRFQSVIFQCMPKSTFEKMGFKKEDFIRLTNTMINIDFSERLEAVRCPVLAVCGEKDNANKKAAKGLADHIAQAELRIIEASGHEANVDEPQRLAEVINDFYIQHAL